MHPTRRLHEVWFYFILFYFMLPNFILMVGNYSALLDPSTRRFMRNKSWFKQEVGKIFMSLVWEQVKEISELENSLYYRSQEPRERRTLFHILMEIGTQRKPPLCTRILRGIQLLDEGDQRN